MKQKNPPASWRDQYHNGWLPKMEPVLNFWIADPAMRALCDRIDAKKVEIARWVRVRYPRHLLDTRGEE